MMCGAEWFQEVDNPNCDNPTDDDFFKEGGGHRINLKYPTPQKDPITECNSADIYILMDESGSFTDTGYRTTVDMLLNMMEATLDGDRVRYTE